MRVTNEYRESLEVSEAAIDILGDIISEALDYNAEDQTIEDEVVEELIDLVNLLTRRYDT